MLEQKTRIPIDHRLFESLLAARDDPAKAGHDFVAHGDEPLTAFGFGFFDDIGHVPGAL